MTAGGRDAFPAEEQTTTAKARTTFERELREVRRARRYATEVLRSWGLESQVPAIELAVSELVSNAICHGSGTIQVELVRIADRVRVVVDDEGSGGATYPTMEPETVDGVRAGGWGLRFVDQLSDRWGVAAEGGHTRVWMETDTRRDAGGQGTSA